MSTKQQYTVSDISDARTANQKKPTLNAWKFLDKGYRVWCRYCLAFHQHGFESRIINASDVPCSVSTSPYKKLGYILKHENVYQLSLMCSMLHQTSITLESIALACQVSLPALVRKLTPYIQLFMRPYCWNPIGCAGLDHDQIHVIRLESMTWVWLVLADVLPEDFSPTFLAR